jgi:signal peptidase I
MKKEGKFKKFWDKFWFIVWKDNSFKGWLISLLELSTGTKLPLVIVESCSMHHQGHLISNFDNWWGKHETKYFKYQITKENFKEFSMKKGFSKGDILFIVGVKPKKIKQGNIIIFEANYKNPIIHRVISINQEKGKYIFSTLGDNNSGQLMIEEEISEEQIIGKAVFNIAPYFGWIKLYLFEFQKPESERGFCEEN